MAQIDGMMVNMSSEVENANQVKNHVIDRLHKDGILTEEQAKEYGYHRHMIIVKPNWFQVLLHKFGYKKDSSYIYQYVRFNLDEDFKGEEE